MDKAEALRDRRGEILRVALDLFSESGFHGTTVRQIARAVGVNEATLYHYFPSKDAILAEVFARTMEARRAELAASLSPMLMAGTAELDGLQRLAALLTAIGRIYLRAAEDPAETKLQRLLMSEGPRLAADGRIAFEAAHRQMLEPALAALAALEASGVRLGMDQELLMFSFLAPLDLWKLAHCMGQQIGDEAYRDRLLAHQIRLVTAAVAAGKPL